MLQQFDPRNKDILININGELLPRKDARVSVFDSVVQGGDAVWEGIRVYEGGIFALQDHLDRLQHSAKSMLFSQVPDNHKIRDEIFKTLQVNNMRKDTHIRLTLTRGEKITSGMNPMLNQKGCTLIVLAEWKPPIYGSKKLKLVTSSIRRNSPQTLDSKIHHNNLINNILAKIEANLYQADDAIMLDLQGFVSETNATNLFMVKNGTLLTPHADSCLPGITRGKVIEIAKKLAIPVVMHNISITEFYNADEVFTTGTMGELAEVSEIDGREIINSGANSIMRKINESFRNLVQEQMEVLPF
ncbi:MAG: aminotransferase class IV [Cyclobacteriaceae bacterium]|nr:MAG: aminotransferase class IV [Cyclobacteriaceae bacterium]